MRFLLLIAFIFSFASLSAQRFFSGNGDYSLLINKNVTVKHAETDKGGFIDSYILRENGVFLYMLSITRVNMPAVTPEVIYGESYKQSYIKECGCEISDEKKVEYKNFDGVRYTILSEMNGARIKGYSVSTVSSGVLFTVNFLAEESKFNSFISEYEKIITNLRFM